MKKLIFGMLVLLSANLKAEMLPKGCYVEFGTNYCWESRDGLTEWFHDGDRASAMSRNGTAIEAIVFGARETIGTLNKCKSDYTTLFNNYNALNSSYTALSTTSSQNFNVANANYAAYKKQVALVNKLKKACGSRCSNIR